MITHNESAAENNSHLHHHHQQQHRRKHSGLWYAELKSVVIVQRSFWQVCGRDAPSDTINQW